MHIPVIRIFEHVEESIESLVTLLQEVDIKMAALARTQISLHLKAAHRREEHMVNQIGVILAPHAPRWKPPSR